MGSKQFIKGMTQLSTLPCKLIFVGGESEQEMFEHYIQGGARNVIPLIVHITHFYYYKSI